jgi:hypothetical protein
MRVNSLGLRGVCFVVGTVFVFDCLQTTSAAQNLTKAAGPERISASAIWMPGTDFFKNAHVVCGHESGEALAWCLIGEMAKAGAPDEAVRFSRRLYHENGGEFGVMWRFQALGPVDMAKVFYPLRDMDDKWAVGNRSYALLLVNGSPPIIDVDDFKRLDIHGMEQNKTYQSVKKQFPKLQLWGGGRGGTMFEPVHKRSGGGGQSFDIYYVLNQGRPAGRWMSGAHFNWDFDANGKLRGTRFTGGVGPLPD